MLTMTDLYAGAGGTTTGAFDVPGLRVVLAANHWPLAIEVHNRNHPTVDHDIADITGVDPRRYPRTDILWASPECRMVYPDCPRNPVADLIHMSGECLCGAFAKPGELDEIGDWFPHVAAHIRGLEAKARDAGVPEPRCRWGWGAARATRPTRTGPLCSSCTLLPLFDLATEGVPA